MFYFRVTSNGKQLRVYPYEVNDKADRQRACDLAQTLAEGVYNTTNSHVQVIENDLRGDTVYCELES